MSDQGQPQAFALRPLDTLFFRDARPFTAGEGTDGQSLFPPSPMTVQGMLRAKLLALGCRGWQKYMADGEYCTDDCPVHSVVGRVGGAPGTLAIRGPWIIADGQWLLPAPMDLVQQEQPLEYGVLSPSSSGPSGNHPGSLYPLVPPGGWEDFKGVNGWLTWDAYSDYLLGNQVKLKQRENLWPPGDLWLEELRPGLGMDSATNRADTGLLYFPRHVRLQEKFRISLGVEVHGLQGMAKALTAVELASFGGEGKAVVIEQASVPPWHQPPPRVADRSLHALVCQTHSHTACLVSTWLVSNLDEPYTAIGRAPGCPGNMGRGADRTPTPSGRMGSGARRAEAPPSLCPCRERLLPAVCHPGGRTRSADHSLEPMYF